MNRDRETVMRHVSALLDEAAGTKIPKDVVARLLVQAAIEIWQEQRPFQDIQQELRFIADNLDPETDFEFMRP